MTNGNGDYTFASLDAGSYQISFEDYYGGAYFSEYYDNAADIDGATSIDIAEGQTVGDIDAALTPIGHITGTVIDSTGAPIEGIEGIGIILYRKQDSAWTEVQLSNPWTDASGKYDLGELEAGTYRVLFHDSTWYRWYGRSKPAIYAYYNNQDDFGSAMDVVLDAGETEIVDATLAPAGGGHIAGTVYAADGVTPLAKKWIAVARKGEYEKYVGITWTNSDGTYDVGGLLSGEYEVKFLDNMVRDYYDEYYDSTNWENAATVTVVAGQTAGNVDATLDPTGHIVGTVTDYTGAPLENAEIYTYQRAENQLLAVGYNEPLADGSYVVNGLDAGTYLISFIDPIGNNAAEFYNGADDLDTATYINLDTGQTKTGVDAALDQAGYISGTVTNTNGAMPGVSCAVYSNFFGTWLSEGSSCTDASGVYKIRGLRPDNYRVGFRTCADYNEFYDNEGDLNHATSVTVTAGATTTVDAELGNVMSVESATGKGEVAFAADNGNMTDLASLSRADLIALGCDASLPEDYSFSYGFFQFDVTVPNAGDAVTMTMYLPDNIGDMSTYWKCIEEPRGSGNWVWKEVPTQLLGNNLARFSITDNGVYDTNSTPRDIHDPGALGLQNSPIPTLSEWGLLAFISLLGGYALRVIRRRS